MRVLTLLTTLPVGAASRSTTAQNRGIESSESALGELPDNAISQEQAHTVRPAGMPRDDSVESPSNFPVHRPSGHLANSSDDRSGQTEAIPTVTDNLNRGTLSPSAARTFAPAPRRRWAIRHGKWSSLCRLTSGGMH